MAGTGTRGVSGPALGGDGDRQGARKGRQWMDGYSTTRAMNQDMGWDGICIAIEVGVG